ncbi:hypothetical protein [Pseudoroseomonas cervicalis]|uniref:hypothetical protein n=1 Tax=Teichococcus cervicalis TaxID=204525 RepID=UPI0022F181AB|nr:hypothetical protein [Pseudoroseomonas cervicalis]WBV42133.1 hypothetical protein PFY06_12925 [Pseudoroseomonas cervicalis]
MLKLAALAYLPVNAVLFGFMSMALALIPGLTRDFGTAATAYYGAAALSFLLALPISWLVARRMLTRRERRLLDAQAGAGDR